MKDSRKEPEICVRTMTPEDLDGVLEVTRQSPEAAQWTSDMFRNDDSRGLCWIAEDGGEIVGFLVARKIREEAEILNLAVTGKGRRRGVATKLLARASDELKHAGVQMCFLEVRESNSAAKAFYTKMGFATIGTRKGYYRHPEEEALCMEKKLTEPTDQDHVPT